MTTGLQNLSKILDRYEAEFEDVKNSKRLAKLRGLRFYNWSNPENSNTFNHIIGLPRTKGVSQPLWDYEKTLFDRLQSSKYVWIKKASGLGISELVLRWIVWKCVYNDKLKGSKIIIVVGPRISLATDLIKRAKALLTDNGVVDDFTTKETTMMINGVEISAYPSYHLSTARGIPNVSIFYADEADFFPTFQQEEVRTIAERYILKSDTRIILVSTPNAPNMLFYKIENEKDSIYDKLFLDYSYGVNKIYDNEQLAIARASPSWQREYCLAYSGLIGNTFSTQGIERAVEKGLLLEKKHGDKLNSYTVKSLACDPGFGSSAFGVCLTEFIDKTIRVLEAIEVPKANFERMLEITLSIIDRYQLSFDNGCRIYVDGSAVSFIRSLKQRLGESEDYQSVIDFYKQSYGAAQVDTRFIERQMFVCPINFGQMHKSLLLHLKMCLERDDGHLAIHPRFTELLTGLRTAVSREFVLDKVSSSNTDCIDAMRMACYAYG